MVPGTCTFVRCLHPLFAATTPSTSSPEYATEYAYLLAYPSVLRKEGRGSATTGRKRRVGFPAEV